MVKKTKNHSSNIGNLLALHSKSDVTSQTQRISIKNTRSSAVSPLIIRDQVPISEDTSLKVVVHVPKELGEAKDRREVNVAGGIKARWALKGDGEAERPPPPYAPGESSDGVEDDGVVEWVCDVDAGKSVDLALVWDIVTPAGNAWVRA